MLTHFRGLTENVTLFGLGRLGGLLQDQFGPR